MSELRARFSISVRGTFLRDLIRLAGLLELTARPVKLGLHTLSKLALPCILHWDLSHFVVLIEANDKRITIHDPSCGVRTMALQDASTHFTGIALELWPAPAFAQAKPRPAVNWRELIGPVKGLKRSLTQMFFLAAALQVVGLVLPLFSQWIIDGPVVSGETDLLGVIVTGFVMFTLVRVALEWTRGWLGLVASQQFGLQWAARIVGHLLRLPMHWFEVRHTGDVLSRFQSMQSIQQTVTGKLVDIFLDGFFALVTLTVMLVYSPVLAASVVAATAGYAVIRVSTHGSFHRASDEALTQEAIAQSHFLESLRAVQTIKLAGLEHQRTSYWSNLAVRAANLRFRTQHMTLGFGAAYGLLFGIQSIAVLGAGAYMTIQGTMTIGMLTAFISYKEEFSVRMQRFVDNLMSTRMLQLHAERLSDIVLTPPEETSGASTDVSGRLSSAVASVTLENVSFRYGEGTDWILRNVDLCIEAGEHVAIVGPTGCGKTTLAKIILGLLEPTEGKLKIDGVSLSQLSLADWRRRVGAVMQDDQLFSASLMENIAGLEEAADVQRVQAAASLAAIHDEIVAMPMGYHTLNGDMGSSLSGGQRQRLLLARALYRDPGVLVLDEATSHLDVSREQLVNDAICNLHLTRITIAHRPDTIAMASRVIELAALNVPKAAGFR